MVRILSSQQIKEIEKKADEQGITYMRLMENAGSACAKIIRTRFDDSGLKKAVIICGKGKNGGDGFVIARKLDENGYKVSVLLAMGLPTADNAVEMYSRLEKTGIDIEVYDSNNENQLNRINSADFIVDCVFGTGFSGVPDKRIGDLFDIISAAPGFVISIDLPSGLCADSSTLNGAAVKADLTITVIAFKYSLIYYPSALFAGETQAVSIGIPEELINQFRGGFSLNISDIKRSFVKRDENSNKGDYGKALIVSGSYEMPGAALLSSAAAVACGTGLVKLCCPDVIYPIMMNNTPEKVLVPVLSNSHGRVSAQAQTRIISEVHKCSAVLIGCGLGNDCDTQTIVKTVLDNSRVPVILDADGINAVCGNIDIIRDACAQVIITPHPGEAARLLGCEISEVEADRTAAAKALYEKTGAVVVLKGSRTVITANGRDFYINLTGNAGMATGGSGDVLSGIILSFICQHMKPFSAAVSAVYVHGAAGDAVAARYSQMGTTPSKIIDALPKLLSNFE